MRTLLIDNYDSFTFNLFHLIAQVSGIEPYVVRNDRHGWEALSRLDYDSIVISPGPGRPENRSDFGVCADAILKSARPLLGVCLGHQGICHLFGGRVRHAPEVMHGRLGRVNHDGSELFTRIPSPFLAVRYHSLVAAEPPPGILEVSAWTDDGVIMALRHKSRPIWGVQFHPESISTEYGSLLISNFLELAQKYRPRRDLGKSSSSTHCARASAGISARRRPSEREKALRLFTRKLGYYREPERVFSRWFGDICPSFWLDSSLVVGGLSRFSFLGGMSAHGRLVSYDTHTQTLSIQRGAGRCTVHKGIFDFLADDLAESHPSGASPPFDFKGGYVGYLGYELKRECGAPFAHRSPYPDSILMFADRFLAFDHEQGLIYLVAIGSPETAPEIGEWFKTWETRLDDLPQSSAPASTYQSDAGRNEPLELVFRHSRDSYLALIEECQRHISDGESYEICLTNMLSAMVQVEPLHTYRILRSINPAPYSAFLRFPRLAVLSSSPECFIRVDSRRNVESKPIKGTIRRGPTPAEDRELAERLRTSEKDRAENLMIVDLVRNDLGTVCEVGSVRVPKLMNVETYATVHHLVSTVRGRLKQGKTAVDCVRAMFPGGSMTGAPKLRTMEIIDKLEGAARGIYSGAIGYFSVDGAADLSIAIRTIVVTAKRAEFGAGGAIVALSDPASEVDEVLLKAKALIRTISSARARIGQATEARLSTQRLGSAARAHSGR
ncbi:MAG: aminodeoxychorismate synthase component I [Candidatus Binataceae bacterium]